MGTEAEMLRIRDELVKRMDGPEYAEALQWQFPRYVDRLGYVRDPGGRIVLVSMLRPADACNVNREQRCWCWLPRGHDADAHLCACGGSWRDDLTVVSYPGPFAIVDVAEEDRHPRPFMSVPRGGIRFIEPPPFLAPALETHQEET